MGINLLARLSQGHQEQSGLPGAEKGGARRGCRRVGASGRQGWYPWTKLMLEVLFARSGRRLPGVSSVLTSEQVRAARMLLRWDQRHLAEKSGVSLPSIKRLEGQPGPMSAYGRTVSAIRRALETAGVVFLEPNGLGPGVRLRETSPTSLP